MKTPLLIKASSFSQSHQDLVLRIQSIRRKNDQYQRMSASDIDSAMAQEILDEKHIIDKQIEQTRRMIDEMDKVFKELPQKNKLKESKKQFEKQLSRYKQVSQALMEKSVIKAEMRNSYRKSLPTGASNRQAQEKMRQVGPPRQSLEHIAQQQELDIDYTMEQNILQHRKQQLGKVQEHMQRVYQVHLDQANMVNQQGQMVDIIGEEMLKAQDNVEGANDELVQAAIQQRKSRKKWYILIFIILFIILLGGGAFFILHDKT